jgi:hypothetical protein
MSHKLNSAVAEIGVEIGKDSFDVAGQDKRDEMHSEASSSSQPSIITRDQGRRGRPRVPSVTAIRKVCSIPEGDDKSGVVQCKISAEPVSVVGQTLPSRDFCGTAALPPETGHWLARLARPKTFTRAGIWRGNRPPCYGRHFPFNF